MEIVKVGDDVLRVFRYGRQNGVPVIELTVFVADPAGEVIAGESGTWRRTATGQPLADTSVGTTGYLDLPVLPGNELITRADFEAEIQTIAASEVGFLGRTNMWLQTWGLAPISAS
jgi:hypothetical protein